MTQDKDNEQNNHDVVHEEGIDIPRGERCPTLEEDEGNVADKAEVGYIGIPWSFEWEDVDGEAL